MQRTWSTPLVEVREWKLQRSESAIFELHNYECVDVLVKSSLLTLNILDLSSTETCEGTLVLRSREPWAHRTLQISKGSTGRRATLSRNRGIGGSSGSHDCCNHLLAWVFKKKVRIQKQDDEMRSWMFQGCEVEAPQALDVIGEIGERGRWSG